MFRNRRTYQNSLLNSAVTWAQFAPEPFAMSNTEIKVTGAKRQGINYEKRAQEYIETTLDKNEHNKKRLEYLRSPWLIFKTLASGDRLQYCQPDGVLLHRDALRGLIIEIKLQHTTEAYYQTRHLYQPVLEKIFPGFSFSILEVVKWLDPHIKFPEPFVYAETLLHFGHKFGVHIYNSGR